MVLKILEKIGERRDLNPRMMESQPTALTNLATPALD